MFLQSSVIHVTTDIMLSQRVNGILIGVNTELSTGRSDEVPKKLTLPNVGTGMREYMGSQSPKGVRPSRR